MQLTVAIDFDGVIHPYTAGWVGPAPADEPPEDATVDLLFWCREVGLRVVIFSTRATDAEGLRGIVDWLSRHEIADLVDEITSEKPPAVAYIDDRAVTFRRDLPAEYAWREAKTGLLALLRADTRWVDPDPRWRPAGAQP